MKRLDFLRSLKSPLPNAVLKKYPQGNLMQYWAENPDLYSASYGQHDDYHLYLGGHAGIDIFTFYGDEVRAAHDGTVLHIYPDPKLPGGIGVWLKSPDLDEEVPGNSQVWTTYCHLKDYVVQEGQAVKQGDLLGHLGNTGFVMSGNIAYWGNAPSEKGAHLHFGLYEYVIKNGQWVSRFTNPMMNSEDPLPYLTGDLSGLANALRNMASFLAKWTGRSAPPASLHS
jgi:murein DD-endopeptidase MepM/ murein hydrolase activator NlpD